MSEKKTKALTKGFLTSEFVFAVISSLLTIAIIGGWIDPDNGENFYDKIAAIIGMALTSVGYTYGRSSLKKEVIKAED